MVAEKEVRAFFHLHHCDKRLACLERHAFLVMESGSAHGFPPTLVFATLVGTDHGEHKGGT